MKKATTKVVKKSKNCNVALKYNNKVVKASGENLLEALDNLKVDGKITTVGILTASEGDKSCERRINLHKLRIFSGNKMQRIVLAKQLSMFLK